jgi:hypothetical protein
VGQTKLRYRIASALNQQRRRCIRPAGGFGLNMAHFVGGKDSHERTNYILRNKPRGANSQRPKPSLLNDRPKP